MQQAVPITNYEAARLAALRRLDLLDSPASELWNRVTRQTADMLGVPMACISLVDEKRHWFLSRVGLDVSEIHIDVGFCAHVVTTDQVLVVADARQDPRFADNLAVTGDLGVQAYLGVPLHAPQGLPVGVLCAVDHVPRDFDAQAISTMRQLASLIEQMLARRQRAGSST